ncbi:MAG: TonB-dependent receptor domain-containing protein, partial [Caldimicrobium sp.]
WDVGIEQGLWKGAKLKAIYFRNNLNDLIYSQKVKDNYELRINVGKAVSKGFELEAEQWLWRQLRFFANFTYTNAKIRKNEAKPELEGKKLKFVPERMFNVGVEFERGPFSASLIGRYVSKRYGTDDNRDRVNSVYTSYDPYFVADAKISYRVTKNASLSFSVNNIFNRQYFEYYKAPGRSWFGELTLKF